MHVFAKLPILTLFFFYFCFFFSVRMSQKGKKKTIKNNTKVSKDKTTITLKLNNAVEIPAENIYKKRFKTLKYQ